jgi:hypothetical protein
MTSQFLLQRMKIPTRNIHPARARCVIQNGHPIDQFCCMFGIDACLRAISEEFLKSCVLEGLDHFNTVSLPDTAVNGKATFWKRRSKRSAFPN